jgi:hypothetical protein
MASSRRRAPGELLALLLLTGCDFGTACSMSAEYAVAVSVQDSLTDAPLLAGVQGSIVDGAYRDSLRPHPWLEGHWAAGFERGGRYEVTVEAPGYRRWYVANVEAPEHSCRVQTQSLTARLQPED